MQVHAQQALLKFDWLIAGWHRSTSKVVLVSTEINKSQLEPIAYTYPVELYDVADAITQFPPAPKGLLLTAEIVKGHITEADTVEHALDAVLKNLEGFG